MKSDIRDFLVDIVRYAEMATSLVEENSLDTLSEKFSVSGLALERCMEVIGEAVKQIPPDIRERYSEIPWKQVAGLRDLLIHRYWSAQMARLVEIVENYLPDLVRVVKQILEDLNAQ